MIRRLSGVSPSMCVALACSVSLGKAQTPCRSSVTGELHMEEFPSKAYQRQQTVRVWLPPGYRDAGNAGRAS